MKKTIFILIITLALVGGVFAQGVRVVPQTTPQVFGCVPKLDLIAPEKINLTIGEETTVQAQVKSLRCIISHVRIDIERLPLNFTSTPEFYTSIPPNKSAFFNLTFFADGKLGNQTYKGQYFIKTNEGGFEKHAVEIRLKEPSVEEQPSIPVPAAEEEKDIGGPITPANETEQFRIDLLIILFI